MSSFEPIHLAFEGIDGAGKTTVRQLVARALGLQYPVASVGQHSWLNPSAAEIILGVRNKRAEYPKKEIIDSYRIDKELLYKHTLKGFSACSYILFDRTFISDVVYLSQIYDVSAEELLDQYSGVIKYPDFVFYFDVEVETAVDRILRRNKRTRHYETIPCLTLIQQTYQRLLHRLPNTVKVICVENSQRPPEETANEILAEIESSSSGFDIQDPGDAELYSFSAHLHG